MHGLQVYNAPIYFQQGYMIFLFIITYKSYLQSYKKCLYAVLNKPFGKCMDMFYRNYILASNDNHIYINPMIPIYMVVNRCI